MRGLKEMKKLHKNKYLLDSDELAMLQRYLGIVIGTPLTYKQLGETMGVTRQRIEQILRKSFKKIGWKQPLLKKVSPDEEYWENKPICINQQNLNQ